ncbi:nicotinate-nucleotide pyrophosphorylase [Gracilaria domingensis]|nr:nicotinate-nucleotide pyrophosphorylase [Gracilaria domingensis]
MLNVQQTLPTRALDTLASAWLREDCPSFDPAAVSLPSASLSAVLYAKSRLVLAGAPFFDAVFRAVGCRVDWIQRDGVLIQPTGKQPLATVHGPVPELLRAERVALNALAEACGVATAAHDAVKVVRSAAWNGRLAMTRKTPPGLRMVHKYAATVGGMDPHRFDLTSPMLKDNHLKAAGSISAAISAVKAVAGFTAKVDVEVSTLSEAVSACEAGADIIMLDNFSPQRIKDTVPVITRQFPNVTIEVSGGITPLSLKDFLIDNVDVISFSIGKYAPQVDLSLKIEGD